MRDPASSLLVVLALMVGAALMPVLSARVRVPAAVLLIAYGLVIGPHGLGLLRESPVEGFLSGFGFFVLMFLAGLEIDFNGLRQRGPRTLGILTVVGLLVLGLAFFTSHLMGFPPVQGLAIGALGIGMPLAVLKETGQLKTPLGQIVLLVGSIGEFFTVIAMTLLDLGVRHGMTGGFVLGLLRLVGFLAVSGLLLKVLSALAWWSPEPFSGLVKQHSSEIGVRASLLVMVVFSVMAVMAGVAPLVGSFLAGALIAFVLRGKGVLEEKLSVVGHGFFVPIFFIGVGLRFHPEGVTGPDLLLTAFLLVVVFGIRFLPSLLLLRAGVRPRDVLASAVLLSCPLTLMVAVATLGEEVGVLDPVAKGSLVLLAIASGVAFPLLFRSLVAGRGAGARATGG